MMRRGFYAGWDPPPGYGPQIRILLLFLGHSYLLAPYVVAGSPDVFCALTK